MPYKDRRARLVYSAKHHAEHRPSPRPQPQARGDLPPYGVLVVDDMGERVQCHVCGRWYAALSAHVKGHGLDADRYREQFGLARTRSLWSPAYQERQRKLSLGRNQGAVGRAALATIAYVGRPPGLENRLDSRISYSAAKRGTYRGRPRSAGETP